MSFHHETHDGITCTNCNECGEDFVCSWGPRIVTWEREHICDTDVAA